MMLNSLRNHALSFEQDLLPNSISEENKILIVAAVAFAAIALLVAAVAYVAYKGYQWCKSSKNIIGESGAPVPPTNPQQLAVPKPSAVAPQAQLAANFDPEALGIEQAQAGDCNILVIGNTRGGKSCMIETMKKLGNTVNGHCSLFSATRDPSLSRFSFLGKEVAVLDTQGINDIAEEKVTNEEICARIRKAVDHAFGGFQNVHAVLFVGAHDGDPVAMEAVPVLRRTFNDDIPHAKKIIVLTRAEKEVILEDYDRPDNLRGVEYRSDYEYVKAHFRDSLETNPHYKETGLNQFEDVLPFGATEVNSSAIQEEIAEFQDNFSTSEYCSRVQQRPFDFVSEAVKNLFISLFDHEPDNYGEVKAAAWRDIENAVQNGTAIAAQNIERGRLVVIAAEKGNLREVQELLKDNAEIPQMARDTAIHKATEKNHPAIIRELLKDDATLSTKDRGADVLLAVRFGYSDVVRELLQGNAIISDEDRRAAIEVAERNISLGREGYYAIAAYLKKQ